MEVSKTEEVEDGNSDDEEVMPELTEVPKEERESEVEDTEDYNYDGNVSKILCLLCEEALEVYLSPDEDEIFDFLFSCCGCKICLSCYDEQLNRKVSVFSCPFCNEPVPTDAKKEFERLMKQANDEFGWAYERVAFAYRFGRGVTPNLDKFIEYLQLAASKDQPSSLYLTSRFHFLGFNSVEKNVEKGLGLLRRSADLGFPKALTMMIAIYEGRMLDSAFKGVKKDFEKALHYHKIAANLGNVHSISRLGTIYFDGKEVPRDMALAVYYFNLGAEAGLKVCQLNLGCILFQSKSEEYKNYVMSVYWLRMFLKDNKKHDKNYEMAKKNIEVILSNQSQCCASCKSVGKAKLTNKCSRCMTVFYCNADCQKRHWKSGHKQECRSI